MARAKLNVRPPGSKLLEVAWRQTAEDDFQLATEAELAELAPSEVRILANRDTAGYRRALTTSGAIRGQLPEASIEVHHTPLPVPGATFRDHGAMVAELTGESSLKAALEGMRRIDAAQLVDVEPTALEVLRSEGLLAEALEYEPPPLAWIVEGLIPEGVEAALVAAGGTGKGLLEVALALHIGCGEDCGAFHVPRPRGVLLLALEDGPEELRRRLRAATDHHFPELTRTEKKKLH
jgi:hypothetical protein